MRLSRPISAAVASSLLAAAVFTGPATAQVAGVGTSQTETQVLAAQLGQNGNLLNLVLLGDSARSTIDPAVASPEAFTRLTVLSTKSGVVSALNQTIGAHEAKSSGPTEQEISGQSIDLPSALGSVLTGSVASGKLSAILNDGVATSSLNAGVGEIRTIGGLVGVGKLRSTLGANSAPADSGATRGVNVEDITVLDLGALLEGLGISLDDLTVGQVSALLDELQATTGLGLPTGETTLAGAVASLNSAIDDLQDALATAGVGETVEQTVSSTTTTLLGSVPLDIALPPTAVVQDSVAAINSAIDDLQDQVTKLLGDALKALDNLALLRLEGVEVGVTTKAVDTVEGSLATVTGRVGRVHIGKVAIPGIDLTAAAAVVNGAVDQVNNQVSSVLGLVSPELANLVKISVLDEVTSITQSGGYTRSRAGITGATATITPPAALGSIVSGITSQAGSIGSLLTVPGVKALGLSTGMLDLGNVLNATAGALSAPAKVQVASVVASSEFTRAGAPAPVEAPGNTLPRTGGPAGIALLALVAAAAGVGLRRWMHRPELQAVRVDSK